MNTRLHTPVLRRLDIINPSAAIEFERQDVDIRIQCSLSNMWYFCTMTSLSFA